MKDCPVKARNSARKAEVEGRAVGGGRGSDSRRMDMGGVQQPSPSSRIPHGRFQGGFGHGPGQAQSPNQTHRQAHLGQVAGGLARGYVHGPTEGQTHRNGQAQGPAQGLAKGVQGYSHGQPQGRVQGYSHGQPQGRGEDGKTIDDFGSLPSGRNRGGGGVGAQGRGGGQVRGTEGR